MSSFRLIKDASFVLSHDNSKFIIDRMRDVLNKRKISEPIFLEIEKNTELKDMIMREFNVPNNHVYE